MVRYYLISLILIFILTGCISSPYRQVKPNGIIENNFFSIKWNVHKWNLNKEATPSKIYLNSFFSSSGEDGTGGGNSLRLNIDYNKREITIRIADYPYRDYSINYGNHYRTDVKKLFDKNEDFKILRKDKSGVPLMFTENDGSKRIYNSKSQEIIYIKNMRCIKGTYISYSTTDRTITKVTNIYCGYYDKLYSQRRFFIKYLYVGAKFQKNWKKYNQFPIEQDLENLIKDAVKKIVEDLEIKNFDTRKMKQESLYHPNKKFQLNKF